MKVSRWIWRSRRGVALVAGVMCAFSLHAQQFQVASQSPDEQAPTIHGRVVADDGGEPLRNAYIVLEDNTQSSVATDAEGRFSLVAPPDAVVALSVGKSGYVRTHVRFRDGTEIRLSRGAVISGTVTDDIGRPLASLVMATGRRTVVSGQASFEGSAVGFTDDMGRYRITGLSAGDYVVGFGGSTVILPGRMALPFADKLPRTYYPNPSTLDEAAVVSLKPGMEISSIDFTIPFVLSPPPRPGATDEPQPSATGSIRGRVTDADGRPERRAMVQLRPVGVWSPPVDTQVDDDGTYAFQNLEPGRYRVLAADMRMQGVPYGQRADSTRGEVIDLRRRSNADRIDISMPRSSVITGRVIDEYGDPMEFVAVLSERVLASGGRWHAAPMGFPGLTNEDGEFRLFGLSPGKYLLSASVVPRPESDSSVHPGYMKTYLPGTPISSQGRLIEIAAGQEIQAPDFALVQKRGLRISGRALMSDGQPFNEAVHILASGRSGAIAPMRSRSTQAGDGMFEFGDLPPGEYVIQAETAYQTRSTEGEFGVTFVTVSDQDVTDANIRLSAGSSITGRVTFENGTPPDDANLELSPVVNDVDFMSFTDNPVARAEIHEDWSFEMHGVNGPRRLQLVRAPEGWALKSISVHGIDMTDQPMMFGTDVQSLSDVEVLLTNRITEVSGVVTEGSGDRASDYAAVMVFPTDRTRWYPRSRFIKQMKVMQDGSFALRGLPPGEYYLAAIDMEDTNLFGTTADVDNLDVLQALSAKALKVTLIEQQQTKIALRVSP